MATRSTIGILYEDGKIDYIYAHWDGYPSHNGRILLEHYKDTQKVKDLISLGDVSILDKEISKPEGHSFEKRVKGYTIFYGRDRGEKGCEPSTVFRKHSMQNQVYAYLFDVNKGTWLYAYEQGSFKCLTKQVCGL